MNDYYLFATLDFLPSRYPIWISHYTPLATHVLAHEPTTKTYYFGIPLDYAHAHQDTTSMLAFEIYASKEDLYDTHLTSEPMGVFLEKMPSACATGLDLRGYKLVAGFLDEGGRKEEAGVMQDVRITAVSREGLEAIVAALKGLVEGVDGSGATLTYMAFEGLNDDVSARIFGRWRTREDLGAFIRREDVIGFWLGNKQHVKSMEQRLYVPNGEGWLHRGSGYAGEEASGKAEM